MLVQCPSCGLQDVRAREAVELTHFEPQDDAWDVLGKANVVQCIHGHCANCGAIFDVAQREIPVQYPSIACFRCGTKRLLRYRVKLLDRTDGVFTFVARVECRRCGAFKVVRRLLAGIGRIKRVKVGWTGIEIERSS